LNERAISPSWVPSVCRTESALDKYRSVNALAETTIGLYKTEKIKPGGPWETLADVELATLEWVD